MCLVSQITCVLVLLIGGVGSIYMIVPVIKTR
jgi:hypothetical protein